MKNENNFKPVNAFEILALLYIVNLIITINQDNRKNNKTHFSKEYEDLLFYFNHFLFLILALYFFFGNISDVNKMMQKGYSQEIINNQKRQVIVTTLTLLAVFINLFVYNYDSFDIYE